MTPPNPYESERLVSEYLLFHYGDADAVFGTLPGPRDAVGFAQRLVDVLIGPEMRPCGVTNSERQFSHEDTKARSIQGKEVALQIRNYVDAEFGATGGTLTALDIGCAVGGSSFDLAARGFNVIGIDYSSAFIRAAQALKDTGELKVDVAVEAARTTQFSASVPSSIPRENVQFEVGDAMALRDDLGNFDVVVAANLICRLPEPQRFLDRLPSLVKPGGQFLLTTPFTWMAEYTPESQWIGGRDDVSGEDCFSALQVRLSPHFKLDLRADIPFVIREHARKFQYTVAQGSRWIRV